MAGAAAAALTPVSVLIEISDADESPAALLSELASFGPGLVSDVHLVQWGYRSDNPQWTAGLTALNAANIPYYMHSQLKLSELRSKALVRIEPDTHLTDGVLNMLIEQMRSAPDGWLSRFCDHFAVSTTIWIEPTGKPTLQAWTDAALAYGWLLVMLVLDSFRFVLNAGAYHRNMDVTARLVSVTFPNRTVLAPHRWWRWGGFGTGMATPLSGGEACMLLPLPGKDQGFGFVLRLLRTHRSMGFGIWLIGYVLYYALFSAPWWSLLFPRTSIPLILGFGFDPRNWPWYWQMLQLAHLIVVAIVSYRQLYVPWGLQSLQILLYPFYLATSPLIFLYARLARSNASYNNAAIGRINAAAASAAALRAVK